MGDSNIKNSLLQIRPFQDLDSYELDMLMTYNPVVSFEPHELLLKQGKKSPGIYIILEGEAVVTARVLGEGAVKLAVLSRGSFVGEISTIEKGPCTATVSAAENLQCILITTTYFDLLAASVPQMHYKIIKGITDIVCGRLRMVFEQIKTYTHSFDIIPRLAFVEFIKSFKRPKNISPSAKNGIELEELQDSHLFNSFSKEDHLTFLAYTRLVEASKRCVLIKEGEENAPCFIILRGAVEINITENAKTAKLAVLGPGDLFGSVYYVDGSASQVSYTTCERAVLLKVDFKNLKKLHEEHTLLWYKFYNEICKSIVVLEGFSYKFFNRLKIENYNRQ